MTQSEHIELKELLDSARTCMTLSARDWSLNSKDAWLYGIVVGWGDCLTEVAKKFSWNGRDVGRLKNYRKQVAKITGEKE